jgi:hypothetical protein
MQLKVLDFLHIGMLAHIKSNKTFLKELLLIKVKNIHVLNNLVNAVSLSLNYSLNLRPELGTGLLDVVRGQTVPHLGHGELHGFHIRMLRLPSPGLNIRQN